jgi:drug/metabolite transporter (DMT)-like permease
VTVRDELAVSMAVGAALLLVAGAAFQGVPALEPRHWAVILWLAVVNTAVAFTLWNHTLRTLSAAESSILNGTMLVQVAVLAWLFLDELLTLRQGMGLVSAGVGAVAVQLRGRARPRLDGEESGRRRLQVDERRQPAGDIDADPRTTDHPDP